MKLSTAIERALIDKMYSMNGHMYGQSEFMCNVLAKDGLHDHVCSVQAMVQQINPSPVKKQALVAALFNAGYITDSMSRADTFAYTTELYVWWVFDLKRKGF